MLTLRKLVPMSMRPRMEIVTMGRAFLFDRTVQVGTSDMAMDNSEERTNMHTEGHCPRARGVSQHVKAYITHTMRKLTVRRRWAMESLTKQTITLKEIVVLSNSVAGGMDAAEGAFTWNYTVWGHEE
jgi:hypothetical protein